MQPTNQLRWKVATQSERTSNPISISKGDLTGVAYILEQLWKDTSGGESWRAIEIVK